MNNNPFLKNMRISKDTIQLTDKVTFDSEDLEHMDERVNTSIQAMKYFEKQKNDCVISQILKYINWEELTYLKENDLLRDCFMLSETIDTGIREELDTSFKYTVNFKINVMPVHKDIEKHLQKFRIQQKIKGF